MRRLLLAALAATAAGCGSWLPTCLPFPGTETALVAEDLLSEGAPGPYKQRTAEPARTEITYAVEGRSYLADLYRGNGSARAGLIAVPGAAPGGRRHARLVEFARTLGRAGFAVLVPDVPGLAALDVSPSDSAIFADAVRFLVDRPDLAPAGRVGIGTFSYSVGPAVLAALDPAVRDRLAFILGVGGYYDIHAELVFATTGWYREDGVWKHRKPNAYAALVFVLSNLDQVADAADRKTLEEMANKRVADPAADVADLAARLGSEGLALYEMATNTDRDRVGELVSKLPAGVRDDIAALDLANKDLSQLRARLLLVHGRDDDIVPYTHSQDLARAAPRARVFVLQGLDHVDFRTQVFDAWTFYCAVDALLGERAPGSGPTSRPWRSF